MPIDVLINDFVRDEVIAGLTPAYAGGDAPKIPHIQSFTHLDPFGTLARVPDSALRDYDFDALPPDRTADFLSKINLARDQHAPIRAMPGPDAIAHDALVPAPLSNGIPPIQHSIWTGNPLNGAIPKQQAFMDSLAKNRRDNPGWTVVLWTDQSRDAINGAAPGSDLGRMRQWAHDNNVVLASIDEVFAGDNRMSLHTECRLEQNKAGTGRAAASDIVRLEVLNRFGGVYVDGDKKVLKPLNDITRSASQNRVRLMLPDDNLRGAVEVPPLGKEVGKGKKVVEVPGFAVGNEKGRVQNCAFCATKGSLVTQRMLETTGENYRKPRADLRNNNKEIVGAERAQRVEVIVRSGPSMMRDATSPESTPLMPLGSIKTYTGTTSWTGEKVYAGSKNPITGLNALGAQQTPEQLQTAASLAAIPPAPLTDRAPLGVEETEALRKAVRGSLTALSYTVANEGGKLDLNHIKPHLAGLSPENQTLAVHAIVNSLTRPQFRGLASQVTDVRLPSGVTVAWDTLETLRTHAAFGDRINMSRLTVQEAALEGNMAFLRYARENNLIDLTATSRVYLDGGMAKLITDNNEGQGGNLDPVKAAIVGGHDEALHYLMSMPQFDAYPHKAAAIELAAKNGQLSNVIALAQKWNQPQSIGPALTMLHQSMEAHVPHTEPSRLYGVLETPLRDDARLRELLGQAANPINGPEHILNFNNQIEQRLHELGIPDNDINALKQGGDLRANIEHVKVQGPIDSEARKQQINTAKRTMGLELLRDFRQRFGGGADLSSATDKLLTDAVQYNAMDQIPEMIDRGVSAAHLNPDQKRNFAMFIQQKAVDGASCDRVLAVSARLGIQDDVLIQAAQRQNSKLITASLNATRPEARRIPPGNFDSQAELAIAHVKFPNSEAGKNAYQNVQVDRLTTAEARELVQKAMVYSHDRLRAGQSGKTSRVEGWQTLLAQIQREPTLMRDANLMALAGDTQAKLVGMTTKLERVRDQFRADAAREPAPDLSQRQATSNAGKVREFFKASPAPARSPDGQRFVPGKGMQ
jgi:hypothetical protein